MAHGFARAAATSVLGLIALQAAASSGGTGRIRALLRDVNTILEHALDPTVPAIPDLRNGGRWGAGGSNTTPATPGNQYGSADAADRWAPPTFRYGSADAADRWTR